MSIDHSPVQQLGGWIRIRRRPQPHERPTVRHFTLDWPASTPKKAEDSAGFHCDNSAAKARTSGSTLMGNLMSTPKQAKTQVPEKPPGHHHSRRTLLALSNPVIDFLAATVSTSENANEGKIEEQSPRNKSNSKHFEMHHEEMPNDSLPVSHPSSPSEMPIPVKTKFKPHDHSTPLQTTSCGVNASVTNGRKIALRSLASPPRPDICHPTEDVQEMSHISTRAPPEKWESNRASLLCPLKAPKRYTRTQKQALSSAMDEDHLSGIDSPLVNHGIRLIASDDIVLRTPSPIRSHISSEHQTECVEPIAILQNSRKISGEQPQAGPKIQVAVEEAQEHKKQDSGETTKTKRRKRQKILVPVHLYDSSDGQRGEKDVTLYDVYLSLATEMIELKRKECKSEEGKQVLKMFYEEVVKGATGIIDDVQKHYVDKLHEMDEERKKIRALRKEFDRLGKTLEEYIKEKNIQGVHPYQFCFTEEDYEL